MDDKGQPLRGRQRHPGVPGRRHAQVRDEDEQEGRVHAGRPRPRRTTRSRPPRRVTRAPFIDTGSTSASRRYLPDIKLCRKSAAAGGGGGGEAEKANAELRETFTRRTELTAAGKYDEAEAAYKELLAKNPTIPRSTTTSARPAPEEGLAAAEAAYQKAIELRPDYARGHRRALASVYLDSGQAEKAIELLTKAATANPQGREGPVQPGRLLPQRRQGDEAAAAFKKAAAVDPANAEVHYHLGTIAVGQNKIAEAVAHLEKYLLDEPDQRPERGDRPGAARGAQAQEGDRRPRGRRPGAHRPGGGARRAPARDVTLVAVSKTQPADAVREAFAAGLRDFGENKVQEAEAKIAALADLRAAGLRWHLVGHLQSNKAPRAATLFDGIHSVDDIAPGQRLERAAEAARKPLPVLVQVDLAGEATKYGLDEAHLFPRWSSCAGSRPCASRGSWCCRPTPTTPRGRGPTSGGCASCATRAAAGPAAGRELSMGMSHDLEVAVEEGATHGARGHRDLRGAEDARDWP